MEATTICTCIVPGLCVKEKCTGNSTQAIDLSVSRDTPQPCVLKANVNGEYATYAWGEC